MRGPETEVREEIFMECSLLGVERERQKEGAKAGYTKLDHYKMNCSSCPCLAGQEVNCSKGCKMDANYS